MLTGKILCILLTKFFKNHSQLLKDSFEFKKTLPYKNEVLFDKNTLI